MNPSGLATLHLAETGSTNSDLLARVHAASQRGDAAFAPCLLVADRQTAGRGRHGRRWHADAGVSLTFSLAWPFAAATDLSGLSLAVGVALADALDPESAPTSADAAANGAAPSRIGLKWPNDLLLVRAGVGRDGTGAVSRDGAAGRKLGGVLIETAPCAAGRVAVVGIGLNVGAQTVAAGDAASGVAWLGEIDAGATPASALQRIVVPLVDALREFERTGFASFAQRFAARDVLHGRWVEAAGSVAGVVTGVSASGDLLVRTGSGVVRVHSGEVRLRLRTGSPVTTC